MPRPICFMSMPYSTKPTGTPPPSEAPDKINFDRLWDAAAADWAKPLFDVDQTRQIRYPLPAESITDDAATEIVEIVQAAVPVMAEGDSPFYPVFATFPRHDLARATAFREKRTGPVAVPVRNYCGPLRHVYTC